MKTLKVSLAGLILSLLGAVDAVALVNDKVPVPEPSSLSAAVSGLALLGGAVWLIRRRK